MAACTPKHTVKDSCDKPTGVRQPCEIGQIVELMLLRTVQAEYKQILVHTLKSQLPSHQRMLCMPETEKQLHYRNG